jgi:hypothetical protein
MRSNSRVCQQHVCTRGVITGLVLHDTSHKQTAVQFAVKCLDCQTPERAGARNRLPNAVQS